MPWAEYTCLNQWRCSPASEIWRDILLYEKKKKKKKKKAVDAVCGEVKANAISCRRT